MMTLSKYYYQKAQIWLLITTAVYFLLNGAQIFETAIIVPLWTSAPPESFHIFQGKYKLDFKIFWIIAHSIHELTFIAAIIFSWKISGTRNWLLAIFIFHAGVRLWTLLYFVPNIVEFQQMPYSNTIDQNLLQRASQWKNLNYARVGIFILLSLGLIPLLNKIFKLKYQNPQL